MVIEQQIRQILTQSLQPQHLDILNESPMHGLPAAAEKHFRVTVAASCFEGESRIERHRRVHTLLADLLKAQIHALALQAFTPEEWAKAAGQTLSSPACLGGGKTSAGRS